MSLSKYISIFLQEMRTNIEQLNQMLIDLERDPEDLNLLQKIMRVSHSCKGACMTMKFQKTGELCHAMEDVFDAGRHAKKKIDVLATDLCLAAMDEIESAISTIEKTQKEPEDIVLTQLLRNWIEGKQIDTSLLEKLRQQKNAGGDDAMFTKISSIRVATDKLDDLMNLAGELSLIQLQLLSSAALSTEEKHKVEEFGSITEQLTSKIIESRLVPLEQVFSRFPRLVRDLAQSQGKQIKFEMSGVDYELDKTLIDNLITPLIHLLRNAVDHGIESPEQRTENEKPPEGTIKLTVYQSEGFTVVTVMDDGRTIDLAHLKEIALKRGIEQSTLDAITEETILDLLCDPRFSSKDAVTDVSGRGVGMAAVRETVAALGGMLELKAEPNKKQFILSLPLQLSIIKSLVVDAGDSTYVLPFIHIQRLLTIPKNDVKSQLGNMGIIVDGEDVPVISLAQAVSDSDAASTHNIETEDDKAHIVLTQTQFGRVGILVDRIRESRDVLVKPIPESMNNAQQYSGSTILDTGLVSMIVDIPRLLSQAHS